MANLNADDVHALEQLRQRLQQLYTSLNSLQINIGQSDTLPPWYTHTQSLASHSHSSLTPYLLHYRSSLQSQFSIISNNFQGLSKQLSQYHDLYASTVAFPLPTFPGRTQDVVLQQLLRTRLEPAVDDWIEHGQTVAQEILYPDPSGGPTKELPQLWEWAPIAASEEAQKQKWGADYTLAEIESGIENVVTGLKRILTIPEEADSDEAEDDDEEDEDDEDDGEEDENEDVEMAGLGVNVKSVDTGPQITDTAGQHNPPMILDNIFRYMMQGAVPP